MAIDVIDEKLLKVLQENGRISISELSKRINLSLSAVSERLKKLESSGVIQQYTAILDPGKMGKNIIAIIMIAMNGDPAPNDFVRYMNSNECIMSCSRVTGGYDYIVKICSDNQKTFQGILDDIKKFKGVVTVHSMVLLGDIKIRYSVPPLATK